MVDIKLFLSCPVLLDFYTPLQIPCPGLWINSKIYRRSKRHKKNTRTVSVSGIVPRNDNFNNKASDVNDELVKMCREAQLDFIAHKNINPRAGLNTSRSRLHLHRNASDKIGKNFVNFILKYYK